MKIFKDNFDIGIQKPLDYPYLQFLRFNLRVLTSWPDKKMGETESKYKFIGSLALKCIASLFFVGGFWYYWKNVDKMTFYDKGHHFITMMMTIVSLIRNFLTKSQNCQDMVVTFLTEMHLFHYKHVSDFALQTHKQINYISIAFTVYMVALCIIGISGFNVYPMYQNYARGNFKEKYLHNTTYEHAVYIELPFDMHTNFNGYIGGMLLNWLESYICTAWFVLWDLLMCSIVFHLWGHYNILLHDLGSFPLPAQKKVVIVNELDETANAAMYSEDEMKEVAKKLKECINYHRQIVIFTKKVSKAFGPMLLVFYVFHQTCGCLLLLECSEMNTQALVVYGPLSGVLFQQLIQVSIIFELIGAASEKLKDAVYGMPWECMDVCNRKTVAIFLINVQEPVHVKAMGLTNVGVRSMAAIFKTSLTYFMFLHSL